jgi:hypothetical protein
MSSNASTATCYDPSNCRLSVRGLCPYAFRGNHMPEFPQSFVSGSIAKGARSTALHSLQWTLGILLTALSSLILAKAPVWLTAGVGGSAGCVLIVLLGSHVYLLLRMPDGLRSESFTLSKMAIEKGLVGDNVSGMHDPRTVNSEPIGLVAIDSNQRGQA